MLNFAINKLKKLSLILDQDDLAEKVFENETVQQKAIALNQSQMYDKGVDSVNDTLGEYSFRTVAIKTQKGQRTDHITLRDTGEFYDSMEATPDGPTITITGDMKKPDTDLEVIYPKALGLNEESKGEIREMAKPIIRREIHRAFGA